MGSRLSVLAVGVLAAASASCGGSTSLAAASTIVLGQPDAGHTVQVRIGDTIKVTLQDDFPVPGSSLVWNVTSLDGSVLQLGVTTRSPQHTGLVGQDTYTAEFHALAAGQAVLDAHGTTSCEAMLKQNCPDRDFTITVVVLGGSSTPRAG
jgi:hypothetical protein